MSTSGMFPMICAVISTLQTEDADDLRNGDVRPLKDYLLEIGRIAGKPGQIGIGRRPDDGTRYRAEWFDTSTLRAQTGFAPSVGFANGVLENLEQLGQ